MPATQTPPFWNEHLTGETKNWMRYLTFRPWFDSVNVIDFEPSSAFGASYIAQIAASVTVATSKGISDQFVLNDRFHTSLLNFDPSSLQADVLLSFEHLNQGNNPDDFLQFLSQSSALMAIGCTKDENWSLTSFQSAIQKHFAGRPIRYLAQQPEFPFRLTEDNFDSANWWVALINEEQQFHWPSLGFAMPSVDSPLEVRDAVFGMVRTYPGELSIAVCANGSSNETLEQLNETAQHMPQGTVTILPSHENLGYGQGCNRALDYLNQQGKFDYLGVINDDVLPDIDCLSELAWCFKILEQHGTNPGLIGPVTNYINGTQQVPFPQVKTYNELLQAASVYRTQTVNTVNQVRQLRGLCFLINPGLLKKIGGFDPIFGLGNFEDDDYNLRAFLAGYTIWIARGSFLYHIGSQTFRKLNLDYSANIARNAEALAKKWQIPSAEQWTTVEKVLPASSLFVPLDSWKCQTSKQTVVINGEVVDLIEQASDSEFAVWIAEELKHRPREIRKKIIDFLKSAA